MMAIELVRPGEIAIRDLPIPEPGPGELVLRVETALTCGTDLKTFRRGHPHVPLPAPMGHEASGTVARVGVGVEGFREGDAVGCVPTVPCGVCALCRRGRDSLCPHAVGRMNFGAFAEFLRLPAHIVSGGTFLRPPGMGADAAAALEPLACVVHGARRVDLAGAAHVIVLGDGPIALLFLQLALLQGAGRVLLAGHHAPRLAVARALGAAAVTEAHGSALREVVTHFTGGAMAEVVVECAGTPRSWQTAPALASPGGAVLFFGGRAAGDTVSFDTYRIHYEEVDHRGAFHYGRADVHDAFELLARQAVRTAPLITHRLPLTRFTEALDLALTRRAIKVAVEPAASA